MTIPFKNIPGNLRVPLFYAELDNSRANTNASPQRALLIGQKTAAGTLAANVPVICQSTFDGRAAAGSGSILSGMIDAYREGDPNGEMWVLPLSDDAAGAQAAGSIEFFGATTAPGSVPLYIGGRYLPVPIPTGQTLAQVATAVAAAINAAIGLPVTAAVDGTSAGKVNITARNKGECGNDIDLRIAYRGVTAGEVMPTTITYIVTPMTGGTTNPALATALSNLNDTGFDFIVCSLTDAASLAAIATLLNDANGRWSWLSQTYGHCWVAKRGTAGTNATFATTLNNQHITNIAFNDSPTPPWKWAAAFAGAAAVSIRADPGVPLQNLAVPGVLPPPLASQFPLSIRNNTLLYGGCATWRVENGRVMMENMVTTYVTNASSAPDDSYLEVETLFLSVYVLRQLRAVVSDKYSRVKLAANGTRLLPGSNTVTPNIIRADLIAKYREMEGNGFVQKAEEFAAGLVVEQNAGNANRIDVLFPATLVGQLRAFAVLFQFRLT